MVQSLQMLCEFANLRLLMNSSFRTDTAVNEHATATTGIESGPHAVRTALVGLLQKAG